MSWLLMRHQGHGLRIEVMASTAKCHIYCGALLSVSASKSGGVGCIMFRVEEPGAPHLNPNQAAPALSAHRPPAATKTPHSSYSSDQTRPRSRVDVGERNPRGHP